MSTAHEVVFSRPLPLRLALAVAALVAAVPTGILLVVTNVDALEELARLGEAVGQRTSLGLFIGLALAPLLALLALVHRLGRRFGRCVATRDWLVFEPALLPAWLGRTVLARDEVVDREVTPHGVRVRARDLVHVFFPFLVPAGSSVEVEAALAEVDRRDGAPLSAGRRFERAWAQGSIVGVLLWIAATALGAHAVLTRRFDGDLAVDGALGCLLLSVPAVLCAAAALLPRIRRVHVGQDGLAVGEELFAYDALTGVAVGEGHLAVAEGPRTCLARVGPDEARVREALLERLRARGREDVLGPLPAAAGRWRRRLRAGLQLAPLLGLPVVAIGASLLAPNYVLRTYEDSGLPPTRVLVVFAQDAPQPVAVVYVGRPRTSRRVAVTVGGLWPQTLRERSDADLELDLTRDTYAEVTKDGARTSAVVWPCSPMADAMKTGGGRPWFLEGLGTPARVVRSLAPEGFDPFAEPE